MLRSHGDTPQRTRRVNDHPHRPRIFRGTKFLRRGHLPYNATDYSGGRLKSIAKPSIGIGVGMILAGAFFLSQGDLTWAGVFGVVGLFDVIIGIWMLKRENNQS